MFLPLTKRKHRSKREGATLVEFAMVFPVVLLFFTGMIEISRVLMLQHTVDTAAYEAARAVMVPGANSQEAVDEATILLAAAGLQATEITVTPEQITEETAFITVHVQVPVAQNSWIAPQAFTAFSVNSEVTLLAERSPIIRLSGLPELKLKARKQKAKGKKPSL